MSPQRPDFTGRLRERASGHSLSCPDPASAVSRSISAFSTTMAPCSRRTQSRPAQARNCLLMLSRVMPTISLISCCVIAMVRPCEAEDVLFGQAKQRTGQPSWQILQDNLLDLIAGRSQPLAEQFDEFHCQRRLSLHKGDEFAPVDDEEFAIAVCNGVGGAGLSVEQRDLAENFPRPNDIEDRVAAIRRGNAHLHRTRNDRVQAVAGIPLGEQRGSPLERGVFGVTAELLESFRLEVGKNRVLAQDR